MDTVPAADRLRAFIDLISGSLNEDVDGHGLASRGYVSRYHFSRLISAALRESPGAFRRRLLLERAAWELGSGRASTLRVAMGAGYRSVEGFSRAFARSFGVTPGSHRSSPKGFRLPAPNGVHFHPPGGLFVSGKHQRSNQMDVVDRLIGHDLWFTNRLLDRAAQLKAEDLDRIVLKSTPRLFGSDPISLRGILDAMVTNKENWAASMEGRTPPGNGGTRVDDLKRRLAEHGSTFERLMKQVRDRGRWDDGFVDALCDPPESFTYGGAFAHIVTFSGYRRSLALLAFRELGVDDLGYGDPIEWERQDA